MRHPCIRLLVATLFLAAPRLDARADGPGSTTVSGQGTYELKQRPEILRVQVEILAKGKSVKEALAKLRERKQAAQQHLEPLGAVAATIEFGDPVVITERNDRERQAMMMMRRMAIGNKKPDQKPKEPPPVVVSCPMQAELPLKASDSEALLILAHELEEKIKAADLGGLKDMKQASPQDEELAQEAAEMGDMEMPKRGEPMFLYVSKVSKEAEVKALAEAFQRARQHAGLLAKASGMGLGGLQRLDDQSSVSAPDVEEAMMPNPYGFRMAMTNMDRWRGTSGSEKLTAEAIGLQPSKVVYRASITASFELIRGPTIRIGQP